MVRQGEGLWFRQCLWRARGCFRAYGGAAAFGLCRSATGRGRGAAGHRWRARAHGGDDRAMGSRRQETGMRLARLGGAAVVAGWLAMLPALAWAACQEGQVDLRGPWGQARFAVEIADTEAARNL